MKVVARRHVVEGLRGMARELDLAAAALRREAANVRDGRVRADYAAAFGRAIVGNGTRKLDEELPAAWGDTVGVVPFNQDGGGQ